MKVDCNNSICEATVEHKGYYLIEFNEIEGFDVETYFCSKTCLITYLFNGV